MRTKAGRPPAFRDDETHRAQRYNSERHHIYHRIEHMIWSLDNDEMRRIEGAIEDALADSDS